MQQRKKMMNFDNYLENYFLRFPQSKIADAMLYAAKGGKHFRPELIFAVVKGFGIDEALAYDAALALEMVHSYSLIHDDLPCMDNDDYRRGKLTVHKAFGEDIAILTGDALLTHAFGVIADSSYSLEVKNKLVSELANLAGLNGMIYGQLLDISYDQEDHIDAATLDKIQDYKTGALFKMALYSGMYIASDLNNQAFYDALALKIGRIFQIQDDLFDIIKSQEETGKSASDVKNNKATSTTLYSIEEVEKQLASMFNDTYRLLDTASFNTEYLRLIIKRMEER